MLKLADGILYAGPLPVFFLYVECQRELPSPANGGGSEVKDFIAVMASDSELESGHI